MKKSQILMSLLLVILLSSCYASRITYENLSIIQRVFKRSNSYYG